MDLCIHLPTVKVRPVMYRHQSVFLYDPTPQWEESFSKHLWFAFVIGVFWLKWAGYLVVAGLNLHTLLSYRIV